uniref:(northern house mosquito) hypothetical protein n=1 Tax=Culex pipiens TaxID=7175 RepID=A0A8D8IRZ8_CULPI
MFNNRNLPNQSWSLPLINVQLSKTSSNSTVDITVVGTTLIPQGRVVFHVNVHIVQRQEGISFLTEQLPLGTIQLDGILRASVLFWPKGFIEVRFGFQNRRVTRNGSVCR